MVTSNLDSDLARFLDGRGYMRLPLECNAVGHFELRAEVNGAPVRLLLDTGASRTVLDQAAASRLNLAAVTSTQRAGGVGTADHAVESAPVDSLILGSLAIQPGTLYVMDLTHVNDALTRHGGSRIDGAVGGDILRPHEAIIDYARSALYLRRSAPTRGE